MCLAEAGSFIWISHVDGRGPAWAISRCFHRSLERCGWIKTSPNVNRLPPPLTTLCHHAREHPQALALKGEVTGAQSRDHVTALALATAVPPTLAPGLAP